MISMSIAVQGQASFFGPSWTKDGLAGHFLDSSRSANAYELIFRRQFLLSAFLNGHFRSAPSAALSQLDGTLLPIAQFDCRRETGVRI
jgi:hypothetical protein